MPIKQSLCIPMYMEKDQSVDDFFAEVKSIGFAAIEFWFRDSLDDYVQVIETAHKHDLVVASMCGHGTLADGLNKYENHERIEEEIRASIDVAVKYNIPGLICFSGNRNQGQSDCEGMIACAKGLRRVIGYAEQNNINLNIELLNSKVDHAMYQADHSDWGAALCEMVDSPRAKLLFDIYHMQIMEGDSIRNIQKTIQYIGHFHTAGNPGRNDMDDAQELNYRGICRAIAATGYEYYVGHEFKPKTGKIEALRTAFEICNQ